jgi:hypothetical protein
MTKILRHKHFKNFRPQGMKLSPLLDCATSRPIVEGPNGEVIFGEEALYVLGLSSTERFDRPHVDDSK